MLELSDTSRRIGSSPDKAVGSFPLPGSGIHWIVGYDRSLLVFTGQTSRDERASLVQPGHPPY
jgi:hypothetical protein